MKTPIFLTIVIGCVAAMVLATTQWLPLKVGLPLGTGAFIVSVLSAVAWILRVAAQKKTTAATFFMVGLFLLLVAVPVTWAVISLFTPAGGRGAWNEVTPEIIFGLLGIASIFRAWIIWSSKDEEA